MPYRLVRLVLFVTTFTVGILGLSGRWTDPWLLTYLALWTLLAVYALSSISDELAHERFAPPEPGADRVPLHFIRVAALGHLVVGALDYGRWHLMPVPAELRIAGMAGMVVFGALIFRSMITNRFFSPVVRIQEERGHRLVDQGPYAVVRHPGYAGMIIAIPCSGLALGSWLGFACAAVYAALIVRRVGFEDTFLRDNLAGYAEYRDRVRYRLVPGLW